MLYVEMMTKDRLLHEVSFSLKGYVCVEYIY